MVIALFLTLLPLLLGAAAEYTAFRRTMRETGRHWRALRLLRLAPPVLVLALAAGVAAGRWSLWQNQEVSPLSQILFLPGVPALFALVGMALGWRLWRRRWKPKIIRE